MFFILFIKLEGTLPKEKKLVLLDAESQPETYINLAFKNQPINLKLLWFVTIPRKKHSISLKQQVKFPMYCIINIF